MNNKLSKKQTMLSFAYSVSTGDKVKGDSQASNKESMKIIKCVMKSADMLKDWTLVWGPRVYDLPLIAAGQSDNTMIVAQKNGTNTYCVAIAGTNPNSWSDWLFEDFWVTTQVPWHYGSPAPGLSPKISSATAFGVSILQSIFPYPGIPGTGKKLAEFLQGELANPSGTGPFEVYVTGHSLGGALAPTTALWLNDTRGTNLPPGQVEWDPGKNATVSTYAFAGATPGNGDFATYINGQFPGEQMVVVKNTLDMVPHAWNFTTMEEIPTLYPPPYILPGYMAVLTDGIAIALKPLDYQPIGSGNQLQPISGTIKQFSPPPNSQLERFLAQAGYQHVEPYALDLGLQQLMTVLAKCA